MLTRRQTLPITLISLLAISLAACGSVEVDLEPTSSSTPDRDHASQPPSEVITALQIAIAQLQSEFPAVGPANDADWEAHDLTPPGLVGSSGYRFMIDGWQIDITYPIVAPQAMIYSINAEHLASDLRWGGTINAQGQILSSSSPILATAWPGRVISGAPTSDLLFEITGEVGTVVLTSGDPAILDRLRAVQDDSGHQGFVHLWGSLGCPTADDALCSLEVTRIRSGTEITEPEPIGPWEGVLFARTGPPASGGDDWFTLLGMWPIQYGIWAVDDALHAELESLHDTGQVIRVWGELTAGLPDWNGTQINVSRFEVVE